MKPSAFIRNMLVAVGFLVAALASARAADWAVNTEDDGVVVATASAEATTAKGRLYTILNVGFGRACQAELGFAMLKDPSYGNAIERYSGKQSLTLVRH